MADTKLWYVYGIVVRGIVRYIGMTCDPKRRLSQHKKREVFKNKKLKLHILYCGLSRKEAAVIETKTIDDTKIKSPEQLWDCYSNSDGARIMWSKPGAKERHSRRHKKAMRRAMSDPKKRRNLLRGLKAGQTSEVHKKLWQDPDYRANRQASHSKAMQNPELRKQLSKKTSAAWADPDKGKRLRSGSRQAIKNGIGVILADPTRREAFLAARGAAIRAGWARRREASNG